MAETIKQTEGVPTSWPDHGLTLSTAAAALDEAMLWQRIEAYIVHRWSARTVAWIVEGPGGWVPPLTPATISTVEVWDCEDDWTAVELSPTPLGGFCLPSCKAYRFTGEVGGGDLPEVVGEAFRRLAEFMAATPGKPGVMSESVTAGSVSIAHRRSPSWMADALRNSGAADLLRPYRRTTA
ncbi:hypothetical protein [Acuticoccus mangrovi]|uniref:Uncharacterized protein n=1 Tax=Acuticoccus mangrovi TaxID=2796142 RepID=A0A934MN52_9HYPH|nr:hypothetical protein [Acuticoccus mangrovi]MBJ3777869.1 hypothetical protein [Acuticoccus mangrovi]